MTQICQHLRGLLNSRKSVSGNSKWHRVTMWVDTAPVLPTTTNISPLFTEMSTCQSFHAVSLLWTLQAEGLFQQHGFVWPCGKTKMFSAHLNYMFSYPSWGMLIIYSSFSHSCSFIIQLYRICNYTWTIFDCGWIMNKMNKSGWTTNITMFQGRVGFVMGLPNLLGSNPRSGSCLGKVLSVFGPGHSSLDDFSCKATFASPTARGRADTCDNTRTQKISKHHGFRRQSQTKLEVKQFWTNSQSLDNLNDRDKGSSGESRNASMRSLATAALQFDLTTAAVSDRLTFPSSLNFWQCLVFWHCTISFSLLTLSTFLKLAQLVLSYLIASPLSLPPWRSGPSWKLLKKVAIVFISIEVFSKSNYLLGSLRMCRKCCEKKTSTENMTLALHLVIGMNSWHETGNFGWKTRWPKCGSSWILSVQFWDQFSIWTLRWSLRIWRNTEYNRNVQYHKTCKQSAQTKENMEINQRKWVKMLKQIQWQNKGESFHRMRPPPGSLGWYGFLGCHTQGEWQDVEETQSREGSSLVATCLGKAPTDLKIRIQVAQSSKILYLVFSCVCVCVKHTHSKEHVTSSFGVFNVELFCRGCQGCWKVWHQRRRFPSSVI